MYDVTALGELLIDFTDSGTSPAGQKVFERNPGGAPANVLVALQRLGHSTAFVGKVGCDMHGAFLRQTLEENDVDCSGLASDPDYFTTLAFVALDPTGERTFSFARKPGADTQLRPKELNRDVLQNTRVLHVGSLSLTDEPARSATLEALRIARGAGAILSYDPNYRASLWPSAEAAAQQMRSVVDMMDLAKISAEETTLLTDESDPNEAARKILEQGPKVVVVTLDADGAMVVTSKGARMVPSFRVDATDTTGAGDGFWGGFLHRMLTLDKRPAALTVADAADCARWGNATAALCITRRGGIPAMPALGDVQALLLR